MGTEQPNLKIKYTHLQNVRNHSLLIIFIFHKLIKVLAAYFLPSLLECLGLLIRSTIFYNLESEVFLPVFLACGL